MKTITYAQLEALLGQAKDDAEAAHEAALILDVDLWGSEYEETLENAIEEQLDALYPDVPPSLVVCGYKRTSLYPTEPDPDEILEHIYERLDEEYNGGDEPSKPTPAVEEAARNLCAVIRREYVPWNCEPVLLVTLDADDVKRSLDRRRVPDETF